MSETQDTEHLKAVPSVTARTGSDAFSAEDVIEHVLTENLGPACITCSFQVEDMIVLNILRRRQPDIPVLFLDTGYHFAETYSYRDRMTVAWRLNLKNLTAKKTVAEQEAEFGILNRTDPGRCCHLRKVEPLFEALENYGVWFTGLRREQSPTRRNLQIIERHELPSGKALLKVSPLAFWTWGEVWKRTAEEKTEYLPLYDAGYLSIGCEPCTSVPAAGSDPRSGRWGGAKLECGIHTFSTQTAS